MVPISYSNRYKNIIVLDPTNDINEDYDILCIRNLISRVIEIAVQDLKNCNKKSYNYEMSYKLFFCKEKEYVKLRELYFSILNIDIDTFVKKLKTLIK